MGSPVASFWRTPPLLPATFRSARQTEPSPHGIVRAVRLRYRRRRPNALTPPPSLLPPSPTAAMATPKTLMIAPGSSFPEEKR